jgi:multidrug efflux pump
MKEFNLAEWAIRHKQIVYFFVISIIIGGLWSYMTLGRSEDPDFTIREMVVAAAWPGASAQEMTEQVTDPLEKKLQDTKGLDYIKSYTHDGETVLYIDLKDEVPASEIQERWQDVRNMVNDEWSSLPSGVVGPVINDRFDDVYGSIYAVTGDGFSYEEKRKYAEDIRQRLLRVPDVQKIELLGVQEQMIYIEMDQNKLAEFGMNPNDVFTIIQQQGTMMPSGMIHTDTRNVAIRVSGLFGTVDSLENLPIHVGARSFHLGDIAKVTQTYTDPESSLMYFNGKPAVGIAISMTPGGNNLTLGENLEAAVKTMQEELPQGLEVSLVADQPKVVNNSIAEFTEALVEALIIVMAASFLSLGFRSGMVLAMCIPVVVCASFLFMKVKGIDLHIVSLGSLIVSLGLLVDDAIIVIEMMQVKLEQGAERMEAAQGAYKACAIPMLCGTLITAGGFLPVALAEGQTTEYTNSLFWVIASTLVLSWIASIFVSPVLGYRFIRVDKSSKWKQFLHDKSYAFFYKAIRMALKYRKTLITGTFVLFAASVACYPFINQEFFPSSVRPELILDVNLSSGASIKDTKSVMSGVADELYGDERVSSFATYIGDTAPRFILLFNPQVAEDSRGEMVIVAKDTDSRDELKKELTEFMANQYPEAQSHIRYITTGPPAEYPVMLRLRGDNMEDTIQYASEALAIMKKDPQLTNASLDWPEETPIVQLEINQDKVRELGIDNYAVSRDLYVKLSGYQVSEAYQGDQLVPISFRLEGDNVERLASLSSLPVHIGEGRYAPLGTFANISFKNETSTIWRRNAKPCITLRADVADGYKADSAALDLYDEQLKDLREKLPAGYSLEPDGTLERSQISTEQILQPVPVMIFFVLTVLIFEMKTIPLMVIAGISGPLGLIGCFLTLFITRKPIGFVALIGMMAIMGMVIRNSIILLDQIRQHREMGMSPFKAIIDSAVLRFRPIMLTSFAEVLGMIPLLPNPFWSPMSAAFIGGLAVATPLGLLFVPALYAEYYRVKDTGEKGSWEK